MHSATSPSVNTMENFGTGKVHLTWSLKSAKSWMIAGLLVSDAISMAIAGGLAIVLRYILMGEWRWDLLAQVWPVVVGYMGAAILRGLYPGVGMHAATELRRLSTTITLVVFALVTFTFWMRTSLTYSRMTLGLLWLYALALIPIGRSVTRKVMISLGLWGYPVAIVGTGANKNWLWEFLAKNKEIGLCPVVAIDALEHRDTEKPSYPHLWWQEVDNHVLFPSVKNVDTAIVLMDGLPEKVTHHLANGMSGFKRIVLLPALEHVSTLGVTPFNINGFLGLEIRNNLLNKAEQSIKRFMDILLVCVGGISISPLLFILGVLVKATSYGPIFYGQERIGRYGRRFKAWKFRTMVQNADQVLQEYLEKDPALRREWETTYKLKNDPRVTPIGHILRKFSLDELPQLWNVLKGEMSLVGPRPIVEGEIKYYGSHFELYTMVRPGITGLWQVSGRNDTTYQERVRLDEYYVRNWSIWLDIYILARTVWVVLKREGAY